MTIFDTIKSLFSSDDIVQRDAVVGLLNGITVSFETINNAVMRLKEDDAHMENVFRMGGIDGKDARDSLSKISDLSVKINTAKSIVLETLAEDFRFVRDGASPRQLAVVALVGDLATTMDVLRNLVLLSIYRLTGDDLYYNSKSADMIKFIDGNSHRVVNLINKDPRRTAKGLTALSSTPLSEGQTGKDIKYMKNVSARFDGNPLYSLGKWWVGRQHERNERRKVEAKLISLKIMDLKSQQNGEESSKVIKDQIEYLESRLAVLDKEITDYEGM